MASPVPVSDTDSAVLETSKNSKKVAYLNVYRNN